MKMKWKIDKDGRIFSWNDGWYNLDNTTLDDIRFETTERWYGDAKIPLRYNGLYFKDFDASRDPEAFRAVQAYSAAINTDDTGWILLNGKNGCGKTHLACAVLQEYLLAKIDEETNGKTVMNFDHCPALFTSELPLISRIKETYRQNATEHEEDIYRELESKILLVIDDVGKYKAVDLSFTQRVLFRVLDYRYNNELPTVITSDRSMAELSSHVGPAVADRIVEMAEFVNFTASSYRIHKKQVSK